MQLDGISVTVYILSKITVLYVNKNRWSSMVIGISELINDKSPVQSINVVR